MAAKKKYDITRLTGLRWEKTRGEDNAEIIDTCDFCKASIYSTSDFFEAFTPITTRDDGSAVSIACKECGLKAGLEW